MTIRTKNSKKYFELGDIIDSGSNSRIYSVIKNNGKHCSNLIAKCSENSKNYISFNLQYHSYMNCFDKLGVNYIIPKIIWYEQECEIGDFLIMQKLENLQEINVFFDNQLCNDNIIKKLAIAMALLHSISISGYDIEFYWNEYEEKIAILDIGPMYTFGVSTSDMLYKHLEIEKNNFMGQWNIISQIADVEYAKAIFKNHDISDANFDFLYSMIEPDSVFLHIRDVASLHALYFFGKFSLQKRKEMVDIFISEYKKNISKISFFNSFYLGHLKKAVYNNITKATAQLYYSTVDTLCKESCCMELN